MQGRKQHAKLSVTFLMSEVRPVKATENDDDIGTLVTTFDETPRRTTVQDQAEEEINQRDRHLKYSVLKLSATSPAGKSVQGHPKWMDERRH